MSSCLCLPKVLGSGVTMGLTNVPHLEWNGERFQRSSPELPPLSGIRDNHMPEIHATFGRIPKKPVSPRVHPVLAFADTGAQTCSDGPEIQKLLGYPDGDLVSTTHRIQVLTNDRLRIMGVLFLCTRMGTKEMRQTVYVSDNTSDFY